MAGTDLAMTYRRMVHDELFTGKITGRELAAKVRKIEGRQLGLFDGARRGGSATGRTALTAAQRDGGPPQV